MLFNELLFNHWNIRGFRGMSLHWASQPQCVHVCVFQGTMPLQRLTRLNTHTHKRIFKKQIYSRSLFPCSDLTCGLTADGTGAPGRSSALDSEPLYDISYRLTVIHELWMSSQKPDLAAVLMMGCIYKHIYLCIWTYSKWRDIQSQFYLIKSVLHTHTHKT